MAGAIRLGELTHLMETRIEQAAEAGAWDAALFAELEEKMDRLSIDLERMATGGEPAPATEAREEPAPGARAEPPLPSPAAMLRIAEGFGAMPPFGATLTLDEIHDVAAYVVEELPH